MPNDAHWRTTLPSKRRCFPSSDEPKARPGSRWISRASTRAIATAWETLCGKKALIISPWPSARSGGRGNREPMLRISYLNERASQYRCWTCSVPTSSCLLAHRDSSGKMQRDAHETHSIFLWKFIKLVERLEILLMLETCSAMH